MLTSRTLPQPDEVRALYVCYSSPIPLPHAAALTSLLSHSWQCNLASTDSPAGPTEEDLQLYA